MNVRTKITDHSRLPATSCPLFRPHSTSSGKSTHLMTAITIHPPIPSFWNSSNGIPAPASSPFGSAFCFGSSSRPFTARRARLRQAFLPSHAMTSLNISSAAFSNSSAPGICKRAARTLRSRLPGNYAEERFDGRFTKHEEQGAKKQTEVGPPRSKTWLKKNRSAPKFCFANSWMTAKELGRFRPKSAIYWFNSKSKAYPAWNSPSATDIPQSPSSTVSNDCSTDSDALREKLPAACRNNWNCSLGELRG